MPMQVMKVIKVMTRMIANHDDDDGDDDGLLVHSARARACPGGARSFCCCILARVLSGFFREHVVRWE